MKLFYAFLIFILLILLSIIVYYYFRLKHIMGRWTTSKNLKNKFKEEKETCLENSRKNSEYLTEISELSKGGPDWNTEAKMSDGSTLAISCVCDDLENECNEKLSDGQRDFLKSQSDDLESQLDFLQIRYDDLEKKLKEEKEYSRKKDEYFEELSELSRSGPDWNWVGDSAPPISCVCN